MRGHNICFYGVLGKLSLNYNVVPSYLEHWLYLSKGASAVFQIRRDNIII